MYTRDYDSQNFDPQDILPEAGGVAFTELYLGGMRVSLTARARNPVKALTELMSAVEHAERQYGATRERHVPAAPAPDAEVIRDGTPIAQQPAPAPLRKAAQADGSEEVFEGGVIEWDGVAKNNSNRWRWRGGPYQKYGVTVWPEVIIQTWGAEPDPAKKPEFSIQGWLVTVLKDEDGKAKKVVRIQKAGK